MTTRITRRRKQKEETKRLILEAAYALFEEKGYHAASMRELADRAEVALGTIFQHFPDKPSLLLAAFETDMEAVIRQAFGSMPSSGLRRQLLHLLRHLFGFYAERPALGRVLMKEILFLERSDAHVLQSLILSLFERIGGLLEDAVQRGELDENIHVPTALMAFWSFYTTGVIGGLRHDAFDVEEQLVMMARLLDQHFPWSTGGAVRP